MEKIYKILSFLLVYFTFYFLYAQNQQNPLQNYISLRLKKTSYKQVLSTISAISNASFVYKSSILPSGTITLEVKNKSLEKVLKRLFKNTSIIYISNGNEIILKKKSTEKFNISGYVKDKTTKEPLPGVLIRVENIQKGTVSNAHGFYSLNLKIDSCILLYTCLGYEKIYKKITLSGDTTMNCLLAEKNEELEEIVIEDISDSDDSFFALPKQGGTNLYYKGVQHMSSFLGEQDLIKILQLLPGVQSSVEGNTGITVRGGDIDQNLILLDRVPIYNSSHLFGFFSVFNPDIVKDASLYKGTIPARYGGKISSILDVQTREGNKYKTKLSGGIGTISGKLTFETPLKKGKGSIISSLRRTHSDFLFNTLFLLSPDSISSNIGRNAFSFGDAFFKGTYQLNYKNKLQISVYYGRDETNFQRQLSNKWDSDTYSLRWIRSINPKLFSSTTFFRSHILNRTIDQFSPELANRRKYTLGSNGVKQDFLYYIDLDAYVDFGIEAIHHRYLFGEILPFGYQSTVQRKEGNKAFALETALYASFTQTFWKNFYINAGLRFSRFDNIGPARVYTYDPNSRIDIDNTIDTIHYAQGNFYHTYQGLEPRFLFKVFLDKKNTLKFTYDLTRQYIHRFNNTNRISPGDIWIPVGLYIRPQFAHIFSGGYQHNILNNAYNFSIEGYYKAIQGQIAFRPFAELSLSDRFETEILQGSGVSYGIEGLLKKNKGKFTGWLSYTYNHVYKLIEGINNNNPYPPAYDRKHNISLVCSYDIASRINISATWIYSSGAPFSIPAGRYKINDILIPYHGPINAFRLPSTHRMDLSVTFFRKKIKKNKTTESNFNISIYNVYNKKNTLAYIFTADEEDPQKINTTRLFFFRIIPSFTYSFFFEA